MPGQVTTPLYLQCSLRCAISTAPVTLWSTTPEPFLDKLLLQAGGVGCSLLSEHSSTDMLPLWLLLPSLELEELTTKEGTVEEGSRNWKETYEQQEGF